MSNICDDLRAAILQALIYDPEKCPKDKKEHLVKLADLPVEYLRGNGLRKTDIIENGKYECILYGELFTKYHDGAIDDRLLSKTNVENTVKSRSGDILIPGTSTASKEVMLRAREIYKDGVEIGGDMNIIRPKVEKMFYPRYVAYVFDTFSSKSQLFQYITGTTGIIHISNSGIKNLVFYLPPLAEQKRIVEKIDELMARVADLEKSADALASLKKSFPSDIRGALLQAAMQGKLTEQLPEDGDAGELLDQIKAEKEKLIAEGKIKKQKPLAPISDDEIPFTVPENWKWERFGNLGSYRKGPFGSALTKSIFVKDSPGSVKVYEQKNAIRKDASLGEYYISREYYENKMRSFRVLPGDIIVSCAGTIGETYVLPDGIREGIINQALMRMRMFGGIYIPYFLTYFNYIIKASAISNSKGSAIKNIPPFEILNMYPVAIPPLAEQKRIVERLDTLMQNIDVVGELIASE